jgi:hypothetical protein
MQPLKKRQYVSGFLFLARPGILKHPISSGTIASSFTNTIIDIWQLLQLTGLKNSLPKLFLIAIRTHVSPAPHMHTYMVWAGRSKSTSLLLAAYSLGFSV